MDGLLMGASSFHRRVTRGFSLCLLAATLILAACGGTPAPMPTSVAGSTATAGAANPVTPTGESSAGATPGATQRLTPQDLPALAQKMNLPRLDGVTLRVLTWPDIYPESLFAPVEQATGALVKRTPIYSTDELITQLAAAGSQPYDLISASADSIRGDIDGGLVQSIDITAIPHYGELVPHLTDLPLSHKDGQVYAVPMVWGYNALIYDHDAIPNPPKSWSVLWDPAYKGKIAIWDDVSFVTDVGRMLGFGDDSAVFHMNDAQLAQVRAKLADLRTQAPIYWENEAELNDLFAQKKVVLALGWLDTAYTLQNAGRDVRATYPNEGAEFWVDHWAIPTGSKQKAAAQALINYALDPQVQAAFFDSTYTVTNPLAVRYITPEQVEKNQRLVDIKVADLTHFMQQFNFSEPVQRRDTYSQLWNSAKAGP
jgi:putative spermidine/putrescine transport system substrate-binding protein/spermidine/putrescine transport system substrate-binding protein